jgi:hypothetical protein
VLLEYVIWGGVLSSSMVPNLCASFDGTVSVV